MILPIRLATNWAIIAKRKQERINDSNACKNNKCIHQEYEVGDQVLLDKPGILQKMTAPRDRPYKIQKVSANGTVRIQKGAITQRVNIWRLHPYHLWIPLGSA